MKQLQSLFAICFLSLFANSAWCLQPDNFIIIFTDDQGYQDLGSYGATEFKTPNLDQLAVEGLRLSDFYAASSVCSPSRASLLTGRYPGRNGVTRVYFPRSSTKGMPASEITLAEVLKNKGYATASIGKWHLGHQKEYLPTNQGFDYFFGIPYSNDMWLAKDLELAGNVKFNNGLDMPAAQAIQAKANDKKSAITDIRKQVPLMRQDQVIEYPVDQSQLTQRYTREAIDFIDKKRGERPFFLYMAHTMPHVPLHVSKAFQGRSKKGAYGDAIEEIDWSVGRIIQYLKEKKLDKNTWVIFTSDNGPWDLANNQGGSALPLSGYKHQSLEGGHRVPAIVWAPDRVPAGRVSKINTSTLDLMPTLTAIAGGELPGDRTIDGENIVSVFTGKPAPHLNQRAFYYLRPDDTAVVEAVRFGDWKYRNVREKSKRSGPTGPHLYNLKNDISETTNLIKKFPQRAKKLEGMMMAFQTELVAEWSKHQ